MTVSGSETDVTFVLFLSVFARPVTVYVLPPWVTCEGMVTSPPMSVTDAAVTIAVLTPPPSFKSYSIPSIVAVSASLVWNVDNAIAATITATTTAIAFNAPVLIC